MSLVPALKFIAQIEPTGTECPEVLSIGQIYRMLGLFAFLALAIAIFSLTSSLTSGV